MSSLFSVSHKNPTAATGTTALGGIGTIPTTSMSSRAAKTTKSTSNPSKSTTSNNSGVPVPEQQQQQQQTQQHPQAQQERQAQQQEHQQQSLDFIGSSHAVKDLFSLPYASVDRPMSVALHNLSGTLLIDAADYITENQDYNPCFYRDDCYNPNNSNNNNCSSYDENNKNTMKEEKQRLLRDEEEEEKEAAQEKVEVSNVNALALVALSSLEMVGSGTGSESDNGSGSEALTIVNSLIVNSSHQNTNMQHDDDDHDDQKEPLGCLPHPDEFIHPFIPPVLEPREYLSWRFRDMSLLVGSNALIYRSPPPSPHISSTSTSTTATALTVRVEDVSFLKALLKRHEELVASGQFLPDDTHNQHNNNNKKPSYAEVVGAATTTTSRHRSLLPNSETNATAAATSTATASSYSSSSSTLTTPATHNTKSGGGGESFSAPDLAQVRLQTCIVPASPLGGGFRSSSSLEQQQQQESSQNNNNNEAVPPLLSPVSTVLDLYLDNIMANVPQLALCLKEKGFVQSVKLVQTDDIPSGLLHSRTLDTTTPFEVISTTGTSTSSSSNSEKMFSPKVMETNASTLLRFLKANCSRDNATYLLRREAGQTSIQLYDITAISTQRQRKWIWWLAMMSYRFASRLRTLGCSSATTSAGAATATLNDAVLRRNCRARQRSLLQNTLDLLEALADMDEVGGNYNNNKHESLVSAVCENLADTFLVVSESKESELASQQQFSNSPTGTTAQQQQSSSLPSSSPPPPATSVVALTEQPYGNLSVDSLNKAQDHLKQAIRGLEPVLQSHVKESKLTGAATTTTAAAAKSSSSSRRKSRLSSSSQVTVVSVVDNNGTSSASNSDSDGDSDQEVVEGGATATSTSMSERRRRRHSLLLLRRVEPVVTQLFGLYHKLVNVSLRLAEIHLRNYYSSSAMQALRISSRTIAACLYVVQLLEEDEDQKRVEDWLSRIQLQYTWLWEHCGHFARSYAADELWRDRGHASGDDIISVLQDAEAAFANYKGLNVNDPLLRSRFIQPDNPLTTKSNNLVNLHSLSGVVDFVVPSRPPISPLGSKSSGDSQSLGISSSSKCCDVSSLEAARKVLDQQRLILRDKRKVLVAASVVYYRAIQSFRQGAMKKDVVDGGTGLSSSDDSALLRLLQQRLGDACNETGKILLNEVRVLLTAGPIIIVHGQKLEGDALHGAAEVLLSSSQFWFLEGLAAFEECRDLRNLALLRCNLCQSYKFRANAMFAPKTMTTGDTQNRHQKQQQHQHHHGHQPTHAELCLQVAANHLQAAHESLSERDMDPVTWDMVSEELAATLLVLGVRRRQSSLLQVMGGDGVGGVISSATMLQALRLSPGQEHLIVDPMERALAIYTQLGNFHQAAASHYQLALYYSKIWTCQVNEGKTREKLAAALEHYNAAYRYFSRSVRGNEVTFCLLSIDLSSLYSAVSGIEATKKALAVCVDSVDSFSPEVIDSTLSNLSSSTITQGGSEWFRQMDTLATSLEECLFKNLRMLVKLEDESGSGGGCSGGMKGGSFSYKELYRTGLRAKMSGAATTTTSTASTEASINSSTGDETIDKTVAKLRTLHSIMSQVRAAGASS